MQRQGLIDRPARSAAEAAALAAGIQAQDFGAARLAVRARSTTLTDADVRKAADAARTVGRSWLMRNTIHVVPADDLRWMTALLGPMIRRRFQTRRWPELGLTPGVLDRVADAAPDALGGRSLTRHEVVAGLAERGVPVDATGQAATHVMLYLATVGLVCHADGDRFALVEEWLPDAAPGPRGADALAELARRYFRAFSPATPADFTAWSGLPSRRAVALIRDELTAHGPRLALGDVPEPGGLRLLGAFDNYVLGHRDRAHLVSAADRPEIYDGGMIRPTVVHDGRIAGRWRLVRPTRKNAPLVVEIRLFGRSSRALRSAIDAEVADIGRFLDAPAERGQLRV
jgi:hypothetical protein